MMALEATVFVEAEGGHYEAEYVEGGTGTVDHWKEFTDHVYKEINRFLSFHKFLKDAVVGVYLESGVVSQDNKQRLAFIEWCRHAKHRSRLNFVWVAHDLNGSNGKVG